MNLWTRRRLRSRWTWIGLVVAAVASVQLYAWYQFRSGRTALAADRPDVAHRHFERSRAIWPWGNRVDVQLLSSRAAWQSGDRTLAMGELREARRASGSTTPELAFEWALLQAVDGNVSDVAEYLQQKADADPSVQRIVWEALTEGYLAVYRANDAFTIAQQWVSRDPDDLRALELRGQAAIQGRGRGLAIGADDLREVLKREPTRIRARAMLSITLLDLGLFDEAIPELERLTRDQPDQPDHRVRLARCLKMTNHPDEAVKLLDAVLQSNPDHGLALRARGQFALSDLRLAEAETWLRRAAEVLPNDYQTQYLLYQALQQAGYATEATEQLKRSETVKQQSTQLADLRTRRLAERPLDPALYTEMGSLLVKTGNTEQGLRWLDVALSLDPGFRPAHEALALHFEKVGNTERAAFHRQQLSRLR